MNATLSPFLMQAAVGLAPGVSSRVQPLACAALAGRRPAGLAADLWWEGLSRDHFSRIPGATVTHSFIKASPGLLYEIRSDLAQRGLLSTGCRAVQVSTQGRLPIEFDPINLSMILRTFETSLQGAVRLVEKTPVGESYLIPSLSFFESGLRVIHGKEAARWAYVIGAILRDELNAHHRHGEQPIGLPAEPLWLGDFNLIVPAFIFALHDLYHAMRMAVLPQPIRDLAVSLYDGLNSLPDQMKSDFPSIEDMLDQLADLLVFPDPTVVTFLKSALNPLEHEMRNVRLRENLFRDSDKAKAYRHLIDAISQAWLPRVSDQSRKGIQSYLEGMMMIFPERPSPPVW